MKERGARESAVKGVGCGLVERTVVRCESLGGRCWIQLWMVLIHSFLLGFAGEQLVGRWKLVVGLLFYSDEGCDGVVWVDVLRTG